MSYLMILGLAVLIAGIFLFFFPNLYERFSKVLDRVVFVLDDVLHPYRILAGLFLLAVGGWMLYLTIVYSEYVGLHPVWFILMVFGLLFIFLPHWLASISDWANKTIYRTDQLVKRACKSVGLVLILAGIFVLYRVFTSP